MAFDDDNKINLVRQLNTVFNKPVEKEASPKEGANVLINKYDAATGTYYADEELAKSKLVQPTVEEIEESRLKQKLSERARERGAKKTPHNYAGFSTEQSDDSWHSRKSK